MAVQPYGFYLLVGERTHVGVTDFDDGNPEPAIQLVERARHYRIHSYLEISKSKGYHVWALIDSIGRVGDMLDWIIQPNDLEKENYKNQDNKTDINNTHNVTGYSLPVCIRRMLNEGITFNQRVACFRLAVHLKRVGLPYDAVIAILTNWRLKNHPKENKGIITASEIEEQVGWTFKKNYSGYGCSEPIIESFCDPKYPVILKNRGN